MRDDIRLWQEEGGLPERNYTRLCLDASVILNGPGAAGPWPECADKLRAEGVTNRKLADLKTFCEEVANSDLVVLRVGTTEVWGVGIVYGDYEWNPWFGDVDGWDIQHVRRVHWFWKADREPKRFPTYTLKLGNTTQELTSPAVREWIGSLDVPQSADPALLPTLPRAKDFREVTIDELGAWLFERGVGADSISALTRGIDDLIRIARWYARTWNTNQPSEHETIAYLVTPLLRILGWTPQKMAIEWSAVDVALFAAMPRSEKTLAAIVEVKKMNEPIWAAFDQARSYAERPGREGCRRLIVTDGRRYGIFLRDGGGTFGDKPAAYLNLESMTPRYFPRQCAIA